MARSLEFCIQKVEGLYYLFSKKMVLISFADTAKLICVFVFCICKKPVFSNAAQMPSFLIKREPHCEKPVLLVSDLVRQKSANLAAEVISTLEISDLESRGIILSREGKTKVLISMHGGVADLHICFFTYAKSRLSQEADHFIPSAISITTLQAGFYCCQ